MIITLVPFNPIPFLFQSGGDIAVELSKVAKQVNLEDNNWNTANFNLKGLFVHSFRLLGSQPCLGTGRTQRCCFVEPVCLWPSLHHTPTGSEFVCPQQQAETLIKHYFFTLLLSSVIERKLNKRFDHERFGLKPAHRFLEAHVTVNDELPNRIASGTVLIKPNVQKMAENDVVSKCTYFC